ncbi:MAG: cytochrome d ubiquinol oxidase subunit II, partial [Proteiniphilum sp.]|nr:cytochrome d ubiquinol oxidase subunit II [Proteiniphilum sp.]
IWTLLAEGYALNPVTKVVYLEKMKYLSNFIDMPIVMVLFIMGVVSVLYGIFNTVFNSKFKKGIWFAGAGTVVTVTMLFLAAGYNNTAYYPSSIDLQSSLTLQNSSSSEFTLSVMAIVSLFVPVVVAYIFYAWRALERKKLSLEDLKTDGNSY